MWAECSILRDHVKRQPCILPFSPPCILCSLRQCECLCVGGRGVWSKAGQSQQEGPDLDMVVKFHWLTGGSLHWLLSVELIIHMVGGREWKPPQKKKRNTKDVATGEEAKRLRGLQLRLFQAVKAQSRARPCNPVCSASEWWVRQEILQEKYMLAILYLSVFIDPAEHKGPFYFFLKDNQSFTDSLISHVLPVRKDLILLKD